jgi:hypothetical protein
MIFFVNLMHFLRNLALKFVVLMNYFRHAYLKRKETIFMTEVYVAIFNLIYAYFTTEIILKQFFSTSLNNMFT